TTSVGEPNGYSFDSLYIFTTYPDSSTSHPIIIINTLITLTMSPSLPCRSLGQNTQFQVPAIGLGFGSLSGFYGATGDLDERVSLLDHAHAAGQRFWDMADIYGDSEDVVGEWLRRSGSKREDV